jgi:hypothetical protein
MLSKSYQLVLLIVVMNKMVIIDDTIRNRDFLLLDFSLKCVAHDLEEVRVIISGRNTIHSIIC